ncbi:hypothetical protein A4X09_0g5009 [Tilletia walkeri]|uniref:Uncharacterized protein n=1 Tax=Tilletia walkeri TaxID=117179 RepID=A0A8X7T3C0_9BASI|nr:hypothetical protein A4X09_0g5009 [Tilletia walkeri]
MPVLATNRRHVGFNICNDWTSSWGAAREVIRTILIFHLLLKLQFATLPMPSGSSACTCLNGPALSFDTATMTTTSKRAWASASPLSQAFGASLLMPSTIAAELTAMDPF